MVPASAPGAEPGDTFKLEERDGGKQRFVVELEFVQALANPAYLHYLAQNQYFDDPAFVKYLKYLQYWKTEAYIKYIKFPHCLFFLDLLQSRSFRESMAHHENKEHVHRQQYYFWLHYRNNRLKQLQAEHRAGADGAGTEAGGEEGGGAEVGADARAGGGVPGVSDGAGVGVGVGAQPNKQTQGGAAAGVGGAAEGSERRVGEGEEAGRSGAQGKGPECASGVPVAGGTAGTSLAGVGRKRPIDEI